MSVSKVDGKWKHTIPKTLQLAGNASPLPVEVDPKVDLEKSDVVYDMHFSDVGGKYKLTLTPRNPQPTGNETVTVQGDVTSLPQNPETVKTAREIKEVITDKSLAAKLYNIVGHSNPTVFKPLLDAVNARDEAAVKKALEGLTKAKYGGLAKELEADIANYQTWTTYMYGSRASRNLDNPSQAGADKMRTPDVLRAEERLAKAAGITSSGIAESDFRVNAKEKHTPVQVSNVYPDQAITVSVFATPKGGQHRIDSFDGSIALSQKQAKIADGEYRNQLIDAIAKSSGNGGVKSQVDKLNTFLTKNKKKEVTLEQYVQFLKDGNINSLRVAELSVQKGKETQVFEGRSMIAGNVCMNRTVGIAYPLFELSIPGQRSVAQPVGPAASMDYSAAVNLVGVQGAESAIGLNPIFAIHKLKETKKTNTPQQQNQPQSSTKP